MSENMNDWRKRLEGHTAENCAGCQGHGASPTPVPCPCGKGLIHRTMHDKHEVHYGKKTYPIELVELLCTACGPMLGREGVSLDGK